MEKFRLCTYGTAVEQGLTLTIDMGNNIAAYALGNCRYRNARLAYGGDYFSERDIAPCSATRHYANQGRTSGSSSPSSLGARSLWCGLGYKFNFVFADF